MTKRDFLFTSKEMVCLHRYTEFTIIFGTVISSYILLLMEKTQFSRHILAFQYLAVAYTLIY